MKSVFSYQSAPPHPKPTSLAIAVLKHFILLLMLGTLALPPISAFAKEPPSDSKPAKKTKTRRPSYPGDDYINMWVKLIGLEGEQKATLDATVDIYSQRLILAKREANTPEGKAAYNSLMKEFMAAVRADFTEAQNAKIDADRAERKLRHSGKKKQQKPETTQ